MRRSSGIGTGIAAVLFVIIVNLLLLGVSVAVVLLVLSLFGVI